MSAICATFYFWVRSIRCENSWIFGVVTGLCYAYMVAAWGGFVFVLNMVGIHAGFLLLVNLLMGRHSSSLHRAYSLFYVIGTFGAIHVPVVGWAPFKSLEQLAPFFVFLAFQLFELCNYLAVQKGYRTGSPEDWRVKLMVFSGAAIVVAVGVAILLPTGFFGPLSARVRGLFLKHTRTGNPLVDSVAEHQPASNDAYWHYLHQAVYTTPVGFFLTFFHIPKIHQSSFLALYGYIAYYFSLRMVRLILLAAPVASALSGIAIGFFFEWVISQMWFSLPHHAPDSKITSFPRINLLHQKYHHFMVNPKMKTVRFVFVGMILFYAVISYPLVTDFIAHSDTMAHQFSHPQIMYKARLNSGEQVIVDDYREAYFWLRDKTPPSSRVMAWWDYGYQITGIGNRTTIADGNTWNHEHIATLGYCLTSPVKRAHSLIRHLADYVLVWGGGGGDDLAKSPHMARIANSVYNDVCPGDPTCSMFGFYSQGKPTPMMAKSLLYNLISSGLKPGAPVLDQSLFKEVFSSKYGLVRIFKVQNVSMESKKWASDPENRKCDAPGSWYCPGQYPPAEPLNLLFTRKRDFKQLEDFNRGNEQNEYHKEYLARMEGKRSGAAPPPQSKPAHEEDDDEPQHQTDYTAWEDDEYTTQMWHLIKDKNYEAVERWLAMDKNLVHMRSADGRGPLWWAHEQKDKKMQALLIKLGAKKDEKDRNGLRPRDL